MTSDTKSTSPAEEACNICRPFGQAAVPELTSIKWSALFLDPSWFLGIDRKVSCSFSVGNMEALDRRIAREQEPKPVPSSCRRSSAGTREAGNTTCDFFHEKQHHTSHMQVHLITLDPSALSDNCLSCPFFHHQALQRTSKVIYTLQTLIRFDT